MPRHLLPLLLLVILHARVLAFTCRDVSGRAALIHSSVDVTHSSQSLFWSNNRARCNNIFTGRYTCSVVLNANSDKGIGDGGGGGGKKKGYRFGDLTKSLIGGSVEKITGKPYEFGDLSRAIDSSVKDKVKDITGNDDYEFGDLSRWVDSTIKVEVNKFTSKDDYQFGDMTKEIMKRVASGKYTLDDLFILLKALAMIGASLSPVAGFLPVKLLVELLNFSLVNDAAGKVTSALAMELDKRLKKSLLGDENYQLGDATKRTIADAVKNYTGKESYEFGDVTKRVISSFADGAKTAKDRQMIGINAEGMEPSISDAFAKWDNLSETDLKDGLDRIEKYVELIENEKRNVTNK